MTEITGVKAEGSNVGKPRGAPDIQKWLESGRTIQLDVTLDGEHIWKYIDLDGKVVQNTVPIELHHFASNKGNHEYGKEFKEIAGEYGLNLDGDWNTDFVVGHKGPHSENYHKFVLKEMKKIHDSLGGGKDQAAEFIELFKKQVIDVVQEDPGILYR